jgi:hypothetical protein
VKEGKEGVVLGVKFGERGERRMKKEIYIGQQLTSFFPSFTHTPTRDCASAPARRRGGGERTKGKEAASSTAFRICAKCAEIAEFLVGKNASYGDSALHPLGIFAKGNAAENLCARLDDKLARIKHAPGAYGEDELKDLTGYLILLQLALEDRRKSAAAPGRRVR